MKISILLPYKENFSPSYAGAVSLFINDTLWGLYTNVEAVNKEFLIDHFSSKYNPFFKCNPDHLDIQTGCENSNLSDTHGPDTLSYLSYYDIESNYGWKDDSIKCAVM